MADSPQIRRTKTCIREALLRLLETHDLGDISVKMLAEEADVNRSTVYAHYGSLLDVLGDCMVEHAGSAHLHIPSPDAPDFYAEVKAAIERSYGDIRERPDLYFMGKRKQSNIGLASHVAVCRAATDEFYEGVVDGIFAIHPDLRISRDHLAVMLEGLSSSLVARWAQAGFLEPPDEIADLTVAAFRGIVEAFDADE